MAAVRANTASAIATLDPRSPRKYSKMPLPNFVVAFTMLARHVQAVKVQQYNAPCEFEEAASRPW